MSWLLELAGKTGNICPPGFTRTGGCPMLIRTSSEDVLTGTVVGILKNLTPQKWLCQWLNESFQTDHFRQSQFEGLDFKLWASLAPPRALKVKEGNSHPDLIITFDDLVIGCEAKFMAPLSIGTSHCSTRGQLLRYIDVFSNHFCAGQFFRKRVYLMTLTLEVPDQVHRYRSKDHIVQDLFELGYSRRYAEDAANAVTIGASTWASLAGILVGNLDAFSVNPVEEAFVLDCASYIWTKISQAKAVLV